MSSEEVNKPLFLKIEAQGKFYHFYYAAIPDAWQILMNDVDGTHLSTEIAGGFVGVVLGMYASSRGSPSTNVADFDWFEYRGDDATFDISNSQTDKSQ